jgi:hypothetical protein
MRGAAVLRQPLPATIESAEQSLRATRSSDELTSVWWRDCDGFEGEHRVRLQAVFTEMLRRFGALQP